MLTLAAELDIDNRVTCLIYGWAAYDPETGAHIGRSSGRRKAGRPTKYWLVSKPFFCEPKRFTAFNDAEALEKARKLMEG